MDTGDSIASSPHSKRNHMRKVLRHRSNIRKKSQTQSANDVIINKHRDDIAKNSNKQLLSVSNLYWEERHDGNVSSGQPQLEEEFNPYEDELLLSVADHLDTVERPKRNNLDGIATGKGFLKCANLIKRPTSDVMCVSHSPINSHCIKQNVEHKAVAMTSNGARKKSIVESILEDFYTSSQSDEDLDYSAVKKSAVTSVDEPSPIVQFKNRPIRTYSGRCKTTACKSILDRSLNSPPVPMLLDDDSESHQSSDISIQNDPSPIHHNTTTIVDLDPIRVSENLANLSSFFSQMSEHELDDDDVAAGDYVESDSGSDSSFESKVTAVRNLVNDIVTLQLRYQCHRKHQRHTLSQEGWPGFNCNRCEESSPYEASVSRMKEDFRYDGIPERYELMSPEAAVGERYEDAWNDHCDFFENFKTQDALISCGGERNREPCGTNVTVAAPAICDQATTAVTITTKNDNTASVKDEYENMFDLCLSEWPMDKENLLSQRNINGQTNFNGFQTASRKDVRILEGAPELPDKIKTTRASQHSKNVEIEKNPRVANIDLLPENCTGFCTASQKPIRVSKTAREKVTHMLVTLPPLADMDSNEFTSDELQMMFCNKVTMVDNVHPPPRKVEIEEGDCNEEVDEAVAVACTLNTLGENKTVPPTSHTTKEPPPDTTPTSRDKSSRVVRKNLLTLNRHKRTMSKNVKSDNLTSTPRTAMSSPFTNLLLDTSTSTSAPRPLNVSINNVTVIEKTDCDDGDQKMKWEERPRAASAASDDQNKNGSSPLPVGTPQQRIERLRAYDEVSPLSAINIARKNNCRPSGLRRCNSKTKK